MVGVGLRKSLEIKDMKARQASFQREVTMTPQEDGGNSGMICELSRALSSSRRARRPWRTVRYTASRSVPDCEEGPPAPETPG